MNTPPIALQLYSVRDAIARQGYDAVVRQVAAMGYAGVETAGFPGTTPLAAGRLFHDLGLTVCSIHSFPIPTDAHQAEILDTLAALGCRVVVTGAGPEDFSTQASTMATCEKLNAAAALFRPAGVRLGVHNHWWEFLPVDSGKRAYEHMLECLSPDVFFEIDTYWVKTGGADPAQVVRQLGPRAPFLHIKDGPAQRGVPQLPAGSGVLDFPAVANAAEHTEWMIVEFDSCATDMLDAVHASYAYLTGAGLAHGAAQVIR
ncbi:MAG: sugar phosphate isomerase/epimerase [Lentisphaerae bacterium]|nr:sugar phosphate isomerase/epimerase [Lentisphaerota bacterium]